MSDQPSVLLSAFADEAANHKSVVEQLSALAAIGLRYYTPRFLDVEGNGEVEHVVDLKKTQYKQLAKLHAEYGMSVASIGSRLGKVKLRDVDDGTHNKFIPFDKYRKTQVADTINAATQLGAKMIRGFSFYHPRQEDPQQHIPQAAEQLSAIVDDCKAAGLVFGLEVESNLIGQSGKLLAALAKAVKKPSMVLIFDGGNLSHQGFSPLDCLDEFRAMLPYLGWMHVKDYQASKKKKPGEHINEEADWNFVPANVGDSGHELIFRLLKTELPAIEKRLKKLGLPGYYVELEPHLKGGGQFGGFSGPDGMGVAVRALCRLLDYTGIGYHLRDFADIRKERGF